MSNEDCYSYTGVDIFKLVFALLIPTLHIPFISSNWIVIIFLQQYLARLGVPFFYVASGFLLYRREVIKKRLNFKSYLTRIGKLYFFWLAIYLPIFIYKYGFSLNLLQSIVFKTPGYLWYINGLIVGSIMIFLVPVNIHIPLAVFLYTIGICLS